MESHRLLQVRCCDGEVDVVDVPCSTKSLTKHSCFVLDASTKLYVWCGQAALAADGNAAKLYAEHCESDRGCDVAQATHELDSRFWELLGGSPGDVARESVPDVSKEMDPRLLTLPPSTHAATAGADLHKENGDTIPDQVTLSDKCSDTSSGDGSEGEVTSSPHRLAASSASFDVNSMDFNDELEMLQEEHARQEREKAALRREAVENTLADSPEVGTPRLQPAALGNAVELAAALQDVVDQNRGEESGSRRTAETPQPHRAHSSRRSASKSLPKGEALTRSASVPMQIGQKPAKKVATRGASKRCGREMRQVKRVLPGSMAGESDGSDPDTSNYGGDASSRCVSEDEAKWTPGGNHGSLRWEGEADPRKEVFDRLYRDWETRNREKELAEAREEHEKRKNTRRGDRQARERLLQPRKVYSSPDPLERERPTWTTSSTARLTPRTEDLYNDHKQRLARLTERQVAKAGREQAVTQVLHHLPRRRPNPSAFVRLHKDAAELARRREERMLHQKQLTDSECRSPGKKTGGDSRSLGFFRLFLDGADRLRERSARAQRIAVEEEVKIRELSVHRNASGDPMVYDRLYEHGLTRKNREVGSCPASPSHSRKGKHEPGPELTPQPRSRRRAPRRPRPGGELSGPGSELEGMSELDYDGSELSEREPYSEPSPNRSIRHALNFAESEEVF
uniref:Gelsolin-like domain-containing protein n=1 Tax=Noctiluca scintillans TaxID=2966 RepID=A0A7S1FBT3_NOCSC